MKKLLNKIKKFSIFNESEEFAKKIAKKIYDGDNPDELYAYEYFFFGIISQFMWIISGIIISVFLNCVLEFCLFSLVWGIERKNCGGMHLDSHSHCYYTTIFLTILFTYIAKISIIFCIPIFVIGFASLIIMSAIVPKKVETTYEYTIDEELMFRKKFCKNTAIFFIADVVLLYFGYTYDNNTYLCLANCISMAILLCSLMLNKWFEHILVFIWKSKL